MDRPNFAKNYRRSNAYTLVGTNGENILVSYKTPVCVKTNGRVYQTETKWSITTAKVIYKWLNDHNISRDDVVKVPQSEINKIVERAIQGL